MNKHYPYIVLRPLRRFLFGCLWKIFPPHFFSVADDKELGLVGEKAAARFLKSRGYKILLHQFQSRYGEIDLVCRDGDTLVFVEVKSRQDNESARPSDSVDPAKQKHISQSALEYLQRLQNPDVCARFDVVEVHWFAPKPRFHLIQDAFPLSEPYCY